MDKELMELQTEYLKGLPEKLDQIYELVLNLEKKKKVEESLNLLKGIIHSIKGTSGSYEIEFLSNLCHKFEDQIALLEKGKSDTTKSFSFIDLMREYLDFFNPGEEVDISEFVQKLNILSSSRTNFKLIEKGFENLKKTLVISFDKFISEGIRLSLSKLKTQVTFIQEETQIKNLNENMDFDLLFIDESAQKFFPFLLPNWEKNMVLKKQAKIFFITSSDNLIFSGKNIIPLIKSHLLIRDIQIASQKALETIKEAPRRILVVDDDVSLHPLFEKAFKDFKKTEILSKGSAKEALQTIDQGGIDLIILDLMMPEVNGIEMFKILKEKKNQIPVIFLTGISKTEQIKELTDLGAKGVISKPFKIGNLAGQIMEIWSRL